MALDTLSTKNVDHLYDLLCHAEQRNDRDSAAALRWAIFQCEQNHSTPTPQGLVLSYAMKPEQELNSIIDTGAFNEIIKGYLVLALQDTGKSSAEIREVLVALDSAFDDADAAQAREAYRKI